MPLVNIGGVFYCVIVCALLLSLQIMNRLVFHFHNAN